MSFCKPLIAILLHNCGSRLMNKLSTALNFSDAILARLEFCNRLLNCLYDGKFWN